MDAAHDTSPTRRRSLAVAHIIASVRSSADGKADAGAIRLYVESGLSPRAFADAVATGRRMRSIVAPSDAPRIAASSASKTAAVRDALAAARAVRS